MRFMKKVGLAAIAAVAMTALGGAGSASATTTLEVGGIAKNESVAIEASLSASSDPTLEWTDGTKLDTCIASELKVATESPYTGLTVSGKPTLSFTCLNTTMRFLNPGTLTIEWIPKSTNGIVTLSGAEFELEWFHNGGYEICKLGNGASIGTLTGTASGHATLDVNMAFQCPSSYRLKATYTITSPTGLGVME